MVINRNIGIRSKSGDFAQQDDIDIDIEIDKYDDFIQEIYQKIKEDLSIIEIDDLNIRTKGMIDKIEDGKLNSLKYYEIKEIDNLVGTNVVDEVRTACVTHTNFDSKKINFAFIKPKTSLDKNPKIPLKFN